tara:strand:- start:231 stop:407 length:177 start_codon:yes stop_codon:yes gene_type:complete
MVNIEKLEELNGVKPVSTSGRKSKKQDRLERYQNKLVSLKTTYDERVAKYTKKIELLQ